MTDIGKVGLYIGQLEEGIGKVSMIIGAADKGIGKVSMIVAGYDHYILGRRTWPPRQTKVVRQSQTGTRKFPLPGEQEI
jgi:hypothetical protein